MVYLTGDTHGDLDRFRHGRLRWLGKRDIVVVLGDFGFVWDGSAEEQKKLDWLRKRPYTLLFLDGSHENYDLLAQYPAIRWIMCSPTTRQADSWILLCWPAARPTSCTSFWTKFC